MDRHADKSARDDRETPKEAEMVFFKKRTDSKICGNKKNAEKPSKAKKPPPKLV